MHERTHCLRLFPHSSLPNPAEVILTAAAVEALRLVFLRTSWHSWKHFPFEGALESRADAAVTAEGTVVACKVGIGLRRGGKEVNLKSPN